LSKKKTNKAEKMGTISLEDLVHQSLSLAFKPGYGIVQNVEFDVALTSTETSSKGGGVGVGVGVPLGATVNIGLQKKLAKSQTVLNRIKFTVPVLFPSKFFPWREERKKKE